MGQWKKILAAFTTGQRITLLLTAAAVCAGLFAFTRWRREADFRPLYTELAPADAGPVIARLKEGGVEYRLSEDGRTISVPSAKVAEVRLSMASAGLPKEGRIGFELFDRTNFGATEFTEQINYARALEGELERSVMCLAEVEQARVHLTFPKDSVFLESREPAKGSVLVKLKPGARLTPQNVLGICHLVSSAVQGLAPETVSVLDMRGNLLNRPRKASPNDGIESSDSMLQFRQSVERDLVAKINTTLEALLGSDKFRASASVECDFSSGEQSEETFDPSRSVMVTSQKTEDISGSSASSGIPGTASNLPRPTSRPAGGQTGVSRRTENIAYQSSRSVRRVKLPMGAVKRMSVAILVDHDVRWEGQGPKARRVLEPPSPEKLKSIRDLVAGAIGLSPERGDQLIVESLPFESTLNFEPPGPPTTLVKPPRETPDWLERLPGDRTLQIVAGIGALVLSGLLAIALMRRKRRTAKVSVRHQLPSAAATEPSPAERERRIERETPNIAELPPVRDKKVDVLANRLREIIKKDPVASAQILRGWLSEEDQ